MAGCHPAGNQLVRVLAVSPFFCAVCCVFPETLFGSRSQIKRKTQGRISFLLKINFKILKAQKEEKSRVGSLLANRRTLCCQFRPFDNEVSLRK